MDPFSREMSKNIEQLNMLVDRLIREIYIDACIDGVFIVYFW